LGKDRSIRAAPPCAWKVGMTYDEAVEKAKMAGPRIGAA